MSPAQVHRPLQKRRSPPCSRRPWAWFWCPEILVDRLKRTIEVLHLSPLFTGIVVLTFVREYCLNAAWQNKMDLAIAIAIGATLQIFLFVAQALVLAGAWLGQPLTLDFELYLIAAVAGAVFHRQFDQFRR
ncbi:hypothetical protein [Methylococcus capsulatus]|uniref:hypothetical protein n=2 Tax=Methylococcaceae TaxID=403 RepID=UPI003217A016